MPPVRHRLSSRHVLAVSLLCAVVLLAGCSDLLADDPELPESDEIADTYDSLDAYNGTFVFTFSTDRTERQRTTGTITTRPGTGERYRTVQSTSRSGERTVVSNGTVRWNYDESANRVFVTETTGETGQRRQIRRLVNRIQTDDSEESSTPAFPIVPFTPGVGTGGQQGSTGLNISTTASYEGTEAVGQREAHVLAVESTGDSGTRGRWTYYLDTEWYVLLRSTSNVTIDGNQTTSSYRLRNVTFNPEVPDSLFEFTPPEGATVDRASTAVERYDNREQLAAATDLRLPDPELPDEFELEQTRRIQANSSEYIILAYASDVATLTVSRQDRIRFDRPVDDGAKRVEIGNRTGRYTQLPRQNLVRWSCDETTQLVRGSLSRATLVEVAASVRC
jgi:outer membrane lipoprotein-sorting protein